MRLVPLEVAAAHSYAAKGEAANSFGEIIFEKVGGELWVHLNLKSGTFFDEHNPPLPKDVAPALEALWAQGIAPDHILYHLPVGIESARKRYINNPAGRVMWKYDNQRRKRAA